MKNYSNVITDCLQVMMVKKRGGRETGRQEGRKVGGRERGRFSQHIQSVVGATSYAKRILCDAKWQI